MVLKRQLGEGGDEGSQFPNRDPKRHQPLSNSFLKELRSGLFLQELVANFEPSFRLWIREEVELALQQHLRCPQNQIEDCEQRQWELHFDEKLPSTLFTGSRIMSEDSTPLKIVLRDANSKEIITSGSLAVIKVTVVALDGDFGPDDRESWSEKEFDSKVIRAREGKRPLLTGDLAITLKDGIGFMGEISFTDNSSWVRGRKFRLAVKADGVSTKGRIKEGISRPFKVKDHRGESYKKHYPPSPTDEVWRLDRIAKDGATHQQLESSNIPCIKELLRLYTTDPDKLRKILGTSASEKGWRAIIDHATTCVLDEEELYTYKATESIVLYFNSIYKAVGVMFDSQNYQSIDNLDLVQKRMVDEYKRLAYRNLKDLVPVDRQFSSCSLYVSNSYIDSFASPSSTVHNHHFGTEQDPVEMQMNSQQSSIQLPCDYDVEDQFPATGTPTSQHVPNFHSALRNTFGRCDSWNEAYIGQYSRTNNSNLSELVVGDHMPGNVPFQVAPSPWPNNGFFSPAENQGVTVLSSDFGIHYCAKKGKKTKVSWSKVLAAFKWRILTKRNTAAKRSMEQVFYLNF